jgi:ribulose-phosphate 3-epimerase
MLLKEQLRSTAPHLSVGVVSADWLSLGTDLRLLEESGNRLLHFDVMDGCFCPMMTLGPAIISKIKTPMIKDVHLMIEEPLDKVAAYVAAGADIVTVHVESTKHAHRVLQALGKMKNANEPERGILRGLALNPGTALEVVEPLLGELDLVLLLAINPGWGGQQFAPSTRGRISRLREIAGGSVLIGVDGGITKENIADVARMGADVVVTGSAVFDGGDVQENLRLLGEAVRSK